MKSRAWAAVLLGASTLSAGDRPASVVLVIIDDVGIDQVSAYGGAVSTPTLDMLAASGIRFDSAYTHPACSSTRASILTGTHPMTNGIGRPIPWSESDPAGEWDLQPEAVTLPEVLAPAGCESFLVGKYHLVAMQNPIQATHPIEIGGFGGFRGILNWLRGDEGWDYDTWPYAKAWSSPAVHGSETMSSRWVTTQQTRDAIEFIWSHPGPSLLVVSYGAVHRPWEPPPPYLADPADDRDSAEAFAEHLVDLDAELALLVNELPEDALLLVAADNGTPNIITPGPAKGSTSQAGILVPFIAWGAPVAEPGRVSTRLIHLVDLFATIVEVCGLPSAPSAIDSLSFADEIDGTRWSGSAPRETAYARRHDPNGLGPWDLVKSAAVSADGYKVTRDTSTPFGDKLWMIDGLDEQEVGFPLTPTQQQIKAELVAYLDELEGP